jgi:hypothetical protein
LQSRATVFTQDGIKRGTHRFDRKELRRRKAPGKANDVWLSGNGKQVPDRRATQPLFRSV